jgi:hypothetical protein
MTVTTEGEAPRRFSLPGLFRRWRLSAPVRGQAFLGAMISLLSLAIFVPPAAHFIESERVLSRPPQQSAVALTLAQAGLKRGLAKLRESDLTWHRARIGTVIPHYNDDLNYSDQRGGFYRIRFVPGPTGREVGVIATGLDRASGDTRAIQAVYTREGLPAALETAGDLALGPSVHVHWGPVMARGTLLLGNDDGFPHKFASGRVVAWDAAPSDAGDRHSFDTSLGDPPALDTDYYRARAKNTEVPLFPSAGGRLEWNGTGSWPVSALPPGTGYFRASANNNEGLRFKASPDGKPYWLSNPTAVILIENDVDTPIETLLAQRGAFLEIEALLLIGKDNHLRLESQGGSLRAVLPAKAEREYGPDARAAWDRFATLQDQPGQCCMSIENAAVRGLVWVEGDLVKRDNGPSSLLGAVNIGGALEARGLEIYYDDAVALGARLKGAGIFRSEWRETTARW